MSALLTKAIAQEAFDLARPSIEGLLGTERAEKRKAVHVVMLDPKDGSILHEESFGDGALVFASGYDRFAREKAKLCYRDGASGDHLKYITPWRYQPGDVRYDGGVYEEGLAVAASGLQSHLDTTVSWTVFNWAAGLCTDERVKLDAKNRKEPPFFQ